MDINAIVTDVMGTQIISAFDNLDLFAVRKINESHPGILRDVLNELTNVSSWEYRVAKAYEALIKHKVPEYAYISAAQKAVKNAIVPESVEKAFKMVKNTLEKVTFVSGCSTYTLNPVVESKLKPLTNAHIKAFGSELGVSDGRFNSVNKIYGRIERIGLVREAVENDGITVAIGDNDSNVNLDMVREGDYGIYISRWNSPDRKGKIFYARPDQLHVVFRQILKEDKLPEQINEIPPLTIRGCSYG